MTDNQEWLALTWKGKGWHDISIRLPSNEFSERMCEDGSFLCFYPLQNEWYAFSPDGNTIDSWPNPRR